MNYSFERRYQPFPLGVWWLWCRHPSKFHPFVLPYRLPAESSTEQKSQREEKGILPCRKPGEASAVVTRLTCTCPECHAHSWCLAWRHAASQIFYHSVPVSVFNQKIVPSSIPLCIFCNFTPPPRSFPLTCVPVCVFMCPSRALPGMMQWIRSQRPGESGINIITADFVELGEFISAVITLNYHLDDDEDDATWEPAGGGDREHSHHRHCFGLCSHSSLFGIYFRRGAALLLSLYLGLQWIQRSNGKRVVEG